ncbi:MULTISPECIES: Pycsar system effector family protein [unclassified Streptomyces]|uniref:Pycsar system effector family protein n=1 Tax=unclassified Streptomyces TaxID=2593676 RepID=UPI00136E905B|nr:integral membrane plasmid transfer protein [Streptomyces sp. SID335]MYZ15734.1 integral membrane plasmid transfer protein [Streptomyces sp. SID337]NDZ84766.1 integral membrane plasmid transfer protein [Streptomyces sp. SID10115]NDZ98742.1 integral membrane plasmid transfer protein [Streptomyces sp. SID10116]NEB43041.1 integral membrane plasmid transfer protein [Streptomyces sp. SID339]
MSVTDLNLSAAHAKVKAEIARTDTKTSLLLAFVGALLAGTWTVAKDTALTVPTCTVGGLGMALLLAAAGLLLSSVRPNLSGRHGFPLWATLSAEEITAELAEDQRARDIAGLAHIAVRRFTALRRAVDLTRAGGALLVLAALLQAGDAL